MDLKCSNISERGNVQMRCRGLITCFLRLDLNRSNRVFDTQTSNGAFFKFKSCTLVDLGISFLRKFRAFLRQSIHSFQHESVDDLFAQ